MAGFQADGVVEALDWDFNPYVKGASGTIPEPTDKQIADFLSGIKKITTAVQADIPDIDPNDTAAVLQAIQDLDPGKTVEQMGQMCEIYSALCSGTPTTEQIAGLPMRVRTIFFAWLQGEVMAPEAVSPGGNAQVTTLPVGRAG